MCAYPFYHYASTYCHSLSPALRHPSPGTGRVKRHEKPLRILILAVYTHCAHPDPFVPASPPGFVDPLTVVGKPGVTRRIIRDPPPRQLGASSKSRRSSFFRNTFSTKRVPSKQQVLSKLVV